MTRQDNKMEKIQCERLGLRHINRRSNRYVPDGLLRHDKKYYTCELKSASRGRKSFSTSSRMGMSKIGQWKIGFDFAVFTIEEDMEDYFLTHQALKPFYDAVRKKQSDGHAGRAGMRLWAEARKALEQSQSLDKADLEKLEKQNLFGSRINDPGISVSDIKKWGTKLNKKRPIVHLKELIEKKCSERGLKDTKFNLDNLPEHLKKEDFGDLLSEEE